jgi:hypothetical protein
MYLVGLSGVTAGAVVAIDRRKRCRAINTSSVIPTNNDIARGLANASPNVTSQSCSSYAIGSHTPAIRNDQRHVVASQDLDALGREERQVARLEPSRPAGSAAFSVGLGWHLVERSGNPRTETVLEPSSLDRFVGEYALSPADVITITREDDSLWARSGGLKYQLFAEGQQEFFMKAVEAQIAFTVDGAGNGTGLTLRYGNSDITARKVR